MPESSDLKSGKPETAKAIYEIAFNNSFQPNIIFAVDSDHIISVNKAACKLLGYSKKILLTKTKADILDIKENSFIKMLKQRKAEGQSYALVTVFKKNGTPLRCEITSAAFRDTDGIEKEISTIVDIRPYTLRQKDIDIKKEKVVSDNILSVKTKQKILDTKNNKTVAHNIKLAKSRQKNIDIKKEKVVSDNILFAKTKQKHLDIKNNKKVAENIKIAKVKQKGIDIKKEKIVSQNILLAKAKQKNLDVKKDKLVASNILLALAASNARLKENNKWIKYIAKTSYDVMWDWDIITDKIYVGDSIKEVFGYKVENNNVAFAGFLSCLASEEKDPVEKKLRQSLISPHKNWDDTFRFKRYDGSVAFVASRACIVRDDKGKAIRLIGAIKDVSRLHELEAGLETQIKIKKDNADVFLQAARLSFDGIWDWNMLTNEFFLGEGFEELFGYSLKDDNSNLANDWSNYLHPDDKESVKKGLMKAIASPVSQWEDNFRFIRADGSVAKVSGRANIIRDNSGKAYRMIGAVHDLSKQYDLEEKLEQEIQLKMQQIADAAADAKDTERADIGKELHDNINQLLGASKLYLEMAKLGGDNSAMYLSRSSEYTHTAIEEIRKLTKGLTTDIIKNLGLIEALENMIRDTMEINPVKIYSDLEQFPEFNVNDKFKLTIFRIIQEHLNNILKHAHAAKVRISLVQNKKSIVLSISDDGIGFDTTIKRSGIGVSNIKSRAELFNGNADVISQQGKGCVLKVMFPLSDQLKRDNLN